MYGIPNIPESPDLAIEVGKRLCEELLEPLQETFDRIAIRSAYRSQGCRQDRGVRGALLADDMCLGKTLQLLALIAWHLERNPAAEPALIVAPVSLLDNWQAEVAKFFEPRLEAMVLPLYGKALSERKVRRGALDDQLRDQRLQGFLKPDWLGSAKLVLTTYETLRDLEFSFAKQRWSVMVCDEAQKIKTPGALMTHAAKARPVPWLRPRAAGRHIHPR